MTKPVNHNTFCAMIAKRIPRTLFQFFQASANDYSDRPVAGMAFGRAFTYGEYLQAITILAFLLQQEGIDKGDRVALLAENSDRWGMAYFSIVRLGAVAVPILPDFTESDVHHILSEAGVKVLFTNRRQLAKMYEYTGPDLKKIITFDTFEDPEIPLAIISLTDYLQAIADFDHQTLSVFRNSPDPVDPEDTAALIYTSGTSGHSKAVMLSHRNLCANVHSASQLIDVKKDWTFLSILPMSHTYEFTIGFLLPLYAGARVVYAGAAPTPAVLEKICREETPSVICAVPMIMEKIYKKKVLATITKSKLLRHASKISFFRRLLYKKIRLKLIDFFGGKLQLIAIGGAAFNAEAETFFYEARFPYLIGYGLTETAPLLSGGPFKDPSIAMGSAGKPVPGVEIKIENADPQTGIGEIHACGPNIMKGYFNNPRLTAETINQEGWISTGDLGRLDEHNNLFVLGRSKSVIVLSNGENVYPEPIEDKINSSVEIAESLVVQAGDRLEAIVYLDYDYIDQLTEGQCQQEKMTFIEYRLQAIRQEVSRQFPAYARLTRIIERQEPFIKTATHKIKRYLYTGPPSS